MSEFVEEAAEKPNQEQRETVGAIPGRAPEPKGDGMSEWAGIEWSHSLPIDVKGLFKYCFLVLLPSSLFSFRRGYLPRRDTYAHLIAQ
jgi:hypothetical protein